MGCGLGCGEVTDVCSVFCVMVTSSASLSSATVSSSHSLKVSGNAHFFCGFGGGGAEIGVGFWAVEGGEGGVDSSHASWTVMAKVFSLYFRGCGGEERARGEESEGGG